MCAEAPSAPSLERLVQQAEISCTFGSSSAALSSEYSSEPFRTQCEHCAQTLTTSNEKHSRRQEGGHRIPASNKALGWYGNAIRHGFSALRIHRERVSRAFVRRYWYSIIRCYWASPNSKCNISWQRYSTWQRQINSESPRQRRPTPG